MNRVESVNKYGKFWFDEYGIHNFQYHPSAEINLDAARYISNQRKESFNGKRYPILVDIRGVKYISKEASQYFSSEENTRLCIAVAFIGGSFLSRMFGNYYINVFTPNNPVKLFADRKTAIDWLLKFKDDNSTHSEKIIKNNKSTLLIEKSDQ